MAELPIPTENLGGLLDFLEMETGQLAERFLLKHYVRDALFDLRGENLEFSSATDTFTTVADQDTYNPGVDGVPGDIRRIKNAWSIQSSTQRIPIKQRPISEIRNRQQTALASSTRPDVFAWWSRSIIFWPTPSSALTISLDYIRDPTLDELTGQPFSEHADERFTNEYFRAGRALLAAHCLIQWGLGAGRDDELSTRQRNKYNKRLASMRAEAFDLAWGDGQMEPHF